MRTLVLGANGLLGSQTLQAATNRDWPVTGTVHTEPPEFESPFFRLDIRDSDRFKRVLDAVEPDCVVNCAAMTDVDACETNTVLAREVNESAPGSLAAVCHCRGIQFCHVSTDYVFDGQSSQPYGETDETDPIQTYGESKLAGEKAVRESHDSALIVRVSFLYGRHGGSGALTGFPAWVCKQLESEGSVPLFIDQWVTPTRAGLAANTILRLLEYDSTGLFHVSSRSCLTPYDFGNLIADRLQVSEAGLKQSSMADVDRQAPRPQYTCLDVSRVEDEINQALPTLDTDLDTVEMGLGGGYSSL
ncbi:dTDP-4-dehydrorhamnose reductase [Haloarcula salina]|uniref:dTDP-4-dehydrorhamnose reductase n=1 Tax=Haloarcula salina TaxID=1429914 RepID=UPI003C70444B